MTTNLFVIVNAKQLWTGGSFRISLPFSRTSWGVGVLNSATFKLIRMFEWNTKHFPLNLQSGSTLSNFRDVGGGFELRNQIRHCKTVCLKRNLYLINYNHMRTQWTTKRNQDAGSSCSCDRGLHRYLRNFGGGLNTPNPPLGTPLLTHTQCSQCLSIFYKQSASISDESSYFSIILPIQYVTDNFTIYTHILFCN